MRYVCLVLVSLAFTQNVTAQTYGYKIDTTPWSNEEFKVCPIPLDNGLKVVVFEPTIENWTYPKEEISSKLETYSDGIREVIIKETIDMPAYHLSEQRIGYLNKNGFWVNSNDQKVTSFYQFETHSGEKTEPKLVNTTERTTYVSNFERESAIAMDMIHNAPPCTKFKFNHNDQRATDITYDFNSNNPLTCGEKSALKRSTELNYIKTVHRSVVCCPDGGNYYLKFPDGKIKVYRANFPIWEVTHNEEEDPICDWNDLGSLKGHDYVK